MHKSKARNPNTPKAKYPNVPGPIRRELFAKVHDPKASSRAPQGDPTPEVKEGA